MSFEISKSFKYLESSLQYRAIRQDLISGNIANADTPYYKARDINFEDMLSKKAYEEFNKHNDKKLPLARTTENMLPGVDEESSDKPTLFFRDGHLTRNDGNSVDLDIESTELSKNSMMYNATIEALKKDAAIFKAVITSSKNI
jgi:flagellar basal-body rod protein FlgB